MKIALINENSQAAKNALIEATPVSYTHLDVYKRQPQW